MGNSQKECSVLSVTPALDHRIMLKCTLQSLIEPSSQGPNPLNHPKCKQRNNFVNVMLQINVFIDPWKLSFISSSMTQHDFVALHHFTVL